MPLCFAAFRLDCPEPVHGPAHLAPVRRGGVPAVRRHCQQRRNIRGRLLRGSEVATGSEEARVGVCAFNTLTPKRDLCESNSTNSPKPPHLPQVPYSASVQTPYPLS